MLQVALVAYLSYREHFHLHTECTEISAQYLNNKLDALIYNQPTTNQLKEFV